MNSSIYINLPVEDLPRSIGFFMKLGFSVKPQFTNETAACMVVSETIFVMLLTHETFRKFTPAGKQLADARHSTEVMISLMKESREEVVALVDAALAAGATIARETEDYGFMFTRSFNDPDGHIWEIGWMDPDKSHAG